MNGLHQIAVAAGIAVGSVFWITLADSQTCLNDCAPGKFSLGVVAPTSGPPAAFGRQAVKPAEIAVREINAAGGLLRVPVELDIDNDQCEPGFAIEAAKRQIEKSKISAVVGPICPEAARVTAPIYSQAGVVQFLPTVSTVGFVRQDLDRLFRMIATDRQEAQALGAYMRREQNGKALTVVFTDAFYRREMAEMVKAALPAEMRASLQLKPLMDSSSAYDHLVDQMKRNPPDVIYVALDNAMVLEFIGKLRKRGVKSLVVGGQRLDSQAFLLTKREVAEGIQIIVPIDTTAAEFRKAADLLEQADVVPDLVALNTYAAIETWAQAVRSAGGADPEKVAQALRSGEFKTAVGRVAFDPRGLRRDVRYSVLTLQGGRLKPIESHP